MKRRLAKKRDLVAELVDKLNGPGSLMEYDARTATLTFLRWEGTDLDPPVRLHVDRKTLRRHLRGQGMRKAAKSLWPDRDRLTGAMNLFTIHIEEEIVTRRPGQIELDLTRDRLEWAHQGIGPSSRK